MSVDSVTLEDMKRLEFYHCIEIADGVVTPGLEELIPLQVPVLEEMRRHGLRGKRVLDIGCRDGLFCFEAERMGASVLGIDNDLSPAATKFLVPFLRSSVMMQNCNVYDFAVPPEDRYDFVIFAGVLYHLRMPFLGLRRIADAIKDGGILPLETAILMTHWHHPFIYTPAITDSPYHEPSSVTFFNHKAMVAGLESIGFRDVESRSFIVLHEGWPRYEGWDAFLASAHAHMAEAGHISIGRGTYVARRDRSMDQADDELNRYWYGTHSLNSNTTRLSEYLQHYRSRRS